MDKKAYKLKIYSEFVGVCPQIIDKIFEKEHVKDVDRFSLISLLQKWFYKLDFVDYVKLSKSENRLIMTIVSKPSKDPVTNIYMNDTEKASMTIHIDRMEQKMSESKDKQSFVNELTDHIKKYIKEKS